MGGSERSEGTATPAYRLQGEVGGLPRSFVLRPGDNVVGAGRMNDVVLRGTGISRRHAVLRATPRGLELEDLGSRNGCFVNGRSRVRAEVRPGDVLGFAGLTLTVTTVEPEDAELGLRVTPAVRATTSVGERQTTAALHRGRGWEVEWLRLARRLVVGHLASVELDPTLALLRNALDADGAAVVSWGGEPGILAASGTVPTLPQLPALLDAEEDPEDPQLRHLRLAGPPPLAIAAVVSGRDEPIGLVVWGDFDGRAEAGVLLGLAARLLAATTPVGGGALPPPPHPSGPPLRFPPGYLATSSPQMAAVYRQLQTAAAGDLPVLLIGETGVGKEPLAATLHASSSRDGKPLVAVNCAALPDELLEAELFGVAKGAATGVAERPGRFLEAAGGTLFLDEIGDMAPPLQAKLLRALQEKEIQPLGRRPLPIDVRIVAATNADLDERMADGRFRRDLYYRLAGYVVRVPALRYRREDIGPLLGHAVRHRAAATGKRVRGITTKALRALVAYAWPGNVRELQHEAQRMVDRCPEGQAIDSTMVSEEIAHPPPRVAAVIDAATAGEPRLEASIELLERRLLRYALRRCEGNQSQAAKLLGISRNGLAHRLKRLGMRPSDALLDEAPTAG